MCQWRGSPLLKKLNLNAGREFAICRQIDRYPQSVCSMHFLSYAKLHTYTYFYQPSLATIFIQRYYIDRFFKAKTDHEGLGLKKSKISSYDSNYTIRIPLCHQVLPSHHRKTGSSQHSQPSPSTPKPMPRSGLRGTGSKSHIPPLAKSSTMRGPVSMNQATRNARFVTLRSHRGGLKGSRRGRTARDRKRCTRMAGACRKKNSIGPEGFVVANWV